MIERITTEQLLLASYNAALPRTIRALLFQAAQTIQEMDKDIAVFEHQITRMQLQQCWEREEMVYKT